MLVAVCTGLLEPRRLRLTLLKSAVNAENFIRRLSLAISSYFSEIYSLNAYHRPNSRKIHQNALFWGKRSFKVFDIDKSKKPVTSTRYNVQHIYIYLQLFSC